MSRSTSWIKNLPPIDRGPLYSPDGHQNNGGSPHDYLRYAHTETGVSPRSIPGQEGGIFWTTSDEHDPRGHITEGAANRISMMEKRMGKLDLAAGEIELDLKLKLHGPEDRRLYPRSAGARPRERFST